jgi:hypothetical protein
MNAGRIEKALRFCRRQGNTSLRQRLGDFDIQYTTAGKEKKAPFSRGGLHIASSGEVYLLEIGSNSACGEKFPENFRPLGEFLPFEKLRTQGL